MFNNKVIRQAVREQARGRVPDLHRIKREQEAQERQGKLSCRWATEKGKRCYMVSICDMYNREVPIVRAEGISEAMARKISSDVAQYNKTNRNRLSMVAKNPSPNNVKSLADHLERVVGIHEISR